MFDGDLSAVSSIAAMETNEDDTIVPILELGWMLVFCLQHKLETSIEADSCSSRDVRRYYRLTESTTRRLVVPLSCSRLQHFFISVRSLRKVVRSTVHHRIFHSKRFIYTDRARKSWNKLNDRKVQFAFLIEYSFLIVILAATRGGRGY